MVTPLAGAVAPSGSKVAWAPCLTHLQLVQGIPPRPDCQVSARLTTGYTRPSDQELWAGVLWLAPLERQPDGFDLKLAREPPSLLAHHTPPAGKTASSSGCASNRGKPTFCLPTDPVIYTL